VKRLLFNLLLALSLYAKPNSPAACKPNLPTGRHTDYFLWPFTHIPRLWTEHASCKPPRTLFGQNTDVPDRGRKTFQVSKWGFMYSSQSKHGLLFRIGTMRYDYNGFFYEVPTLALKHEKPKDSVYNHTTAQMILEGDPEALNVIRRGIEADPNLNGVKIIAVPAALIEPRQEKK
jgi:hypothetical protein